MKRMSLLFAITALICGVFFDAANSAERQGQDATTSEAKRVIVVRAQLFEVSHAKMRELGFDLQTSDGKRVHQLDGPISQHPAENLFDLLHALCKNKMARILAAPTVATLDGRAASLSVGSTIEISGDEASGKGRDFISLGTDLELVPHITADNKVRIELRLEWKGVDDHQSDIRIPVTPKIRHLRIDTAFETSFGETFLVTGSTGRASKEKQDDNTSLVLMLTPEVADARQIGSRDGLRLDKNIVRAAPARK